MTQATVVRYQATPEGADENERLIWAVVTELATTNPGQLRYVAFRLDDGVTFLHVAVVDGDQNPLSASPAFAEFQSGLKDRCSSPPAPSRANVIGSYGLPSD